MEAVLLKETRKSPPSSERRLPTVEEWELIGGKPMWLVPSEMAHRTPDATIQACNSFVVHRRGNEYIVVDTPLSGSSPSGLAPHMSRLVEIDTGGTRLHVPAFLVYELHGQPCEQRSGKERYERLSEKDFQATLQALKYRGYVDLLNPES